MADRYIDHEETLIYGPYAARKIRAVALGLIPQFDAALTYLAKEIDGMTAAMEKSIGDARKSDTARRASTKERTPALQEGLDVLRRFSKHLDAHKAGVVDKRRYFSGGSVSELGTSAPRVLLALSQIAIALSARDSGVREAKEWQKEITEAAHQLAPVIEHGDSARTTRRTQTAELEQSRSAWLQVYVAARCTVEAVLRLTGKLHLITTIFYDLAVPSDAKVTEAPADHDAAVAPVAPAEPEPEPEPTTKKRTPRKRR